MADTSVIYKRIAPSAPLSLQFEDGESRKVLNFQLAFDFNAFARIEEKTGLNALNQHIFKNLNATNLVVLFWAALALYQPEYVGEEGLEAVGTYITEENQLDIAKALKTAFLNSLSPKKREAILAAEKAIEEAQKNNEGAPENPQQAAPVTTT